MLFFQILRSAWIWTASSTLILLWAPLLFVVRLSERDPRRMRTGRWFRRLGPALAKVNRWKVLVSGLEHLRLDTPYVIVSNHQSLADIPVIAHLQVDAKWLAKVELFRLPLVGWMLRMAGDIPVDRSNRSRSGRSLIECARRLRQRCSVVFFPEGTRSRDGGVLPFAEGPFRLAIREQVSILPLVVEGAAGALPKHSWLFGPRQDIRLRVLQAVSIAGWELDRSAALRDHVRQQIVDELCSLRRNGSGAPAQPQPAPAAKR